MLTYATKETNHLKRLVRSFEDKGIPIQVLGLGEKWKGYGQKVIGLKQEMENYKNNPNKLVLFTDDDVLLTFAAEKNDIVQKFKSFNARVVFSAEANCWPDSSLSSKYNFGNL